MATDIKIGLSLVEADEKLNEMLAHPSSFGALMLEVEAEVTRLIGRGRLCNRAHLVPALLDAMYDRLRRLDPFCQGGEQESPAKRPAAKESGVSGQGWASGADAKE